MVAELSILKLLELVSYSKFDFFLPDIGLNKPAKGKCLVRKASDKEVSL